MFKYGIDQLTVKKVMAIANGSLKAIINQAAIKKIEDCRQNVETIACSNQAVYGINTGFGPCATFKSHPRRPANYKKTY